MYSDWRLLHIATQQCPYCALHSRIDHANFENRRPRHQFPDKELGLPASPSIIVFVRIAPVPCPHDCPINLRQFTEGVEKLRIAHSGMAVREREAQSQFLYLLCRRHETNHRCLPLVITLNVAAADREEHGRARREVEWDVVV